MTMDNSRKLELKSDIKIINEKISCEEQTEITTTPIKVAKRPFDVAFLMLPDDKLKQKQTKLLKNNYDKLAQVVFTNNNNNNEDDEDEDEEIEVGNNQEFSNRLQNHHQKYFTQKQQIFDDPNNLLKTKNFEDLRSNKTTLTSTEVVVQKSAFTKVNLANNNNNNNKELRLSPNLSISPDLSYQNSLSPSPPIINHNRNNYQNILFKNHQHHQQQLTYHNNFLPENFPPTTTALDAHHPFLIKNPNDLIHHSPNYSKIRPSLYRPELAYNNYQQFPAPNQDMLKMPTPAATDIRGPAAAAILTSLLPPSLAALSLPSQNVCAKCNISFRMTSDLVYHMRSHHKNDSVDMYRRRREEKLKCPVCAESFRERHHLTRHMTAHQDKDEEENNVSNNSNNSSGKKCV